MTSTLPSTPPPGTTLTPGQEVGVAVIGSGSAGLGLAARLRQRTPARSEVTA